MKLTTKSRYAVTAMLDIASHNTGSPISLPEISHRQNISLSYLEQLFALLRKNNLVSGVRGPGGGYRLSEDPENITIAQIIKAISSENDVEIVSDKKDEVIWDKFSAKLCTYLESVTLGSLINENSSENKETSESLESVPVEKTKWNVV